MPSIGIPNDLSNNSQFSNVRMARPLSTTSLKDDDSGQKFDKDIIDKVNGTGGVNSKAEVYKNRYKKNIDKDEFLKMLTFQLQNQDPMKPMDQLQMTGELAQLSQLDQITQMKNLMEKQNQGQLLESKFYGAGLLGKKVYSRGDMINFGGDGSTSHLRFKLQLPAETVLVRLLDKKGNIVFQKDVGKMSAGPQDIKWSGEMLDGGLASKGAYQLQVMAYDESKAPVPVETQMSGVINGVEYQNGEIVLSVDGQRLDLKNVERLELPEATSPKLNQLPELAKKNEIIPDIVRKEENPMTN